jgi:iron complex transport system permease protein
VLGIHHRDLSVVNSSTSFSITRWLIGSIDSVDYGLLSAFVAIVIGALVVMREAKSNRLRWIGVGSHWGVRAARLTMTGYVVGSTHCRHRCATGPIGPSVSSCSPRAHADRRGSSRPDAVRLLGGGVLLAVCDVVGRLVMAPSEVPAGAVMAMIGGPYLVWVLRPRTGALEG